LHMRTFPQASQFLDATPHEQSLNRPNFWPETRDLGPPSIEDRMQVKDRMDYHV